MRTLSIFLNDLFATRINKDIQIFFDWIFNKRNPYSTILIDLFDYFIREGFLSTDNQLKPNEMSYYLNIIELSRKDISISRSEFPVIEDKIAKRRFFRWLRNVSRNDLGLLPENPDEIIPISIICSPENLLLIENTYKVIGYKESLQWLNNFIDNYKFSKLKELLPFTVGPCIIISNEKISIEDSVLLPRVMSHFYYNNQLGVIIMPDISLIVVRKGILISSNLLIEHPDRFEDIIILAKSLGWEISKIRIKY